jgi:prepilin-type N-terminal cleavage/methylation domain-containing protein
MHRTTNNATLGMQRARAGFSLIELLVVITIIVILASLVLAVSGGVIRASENRATRNTLEILNAATEEYERVMDRRVTYRSFQPIAGGIGADPLPSATAVYDINGDLTLSTTIPPGSASPGVTGWASPPPGLQQPYSSIPPGPPQAGHGLPAYSTLPFRRTATLLWILTQSQASAPIIQRLPDSVLRNIKLGGTGSSNSLLRHCVDSWDTPIIAVFPGREATQAELAAANPNVVDADGTVRCDSEAAPANQGGMVKIRCKDRRILWVSAGNDTRFNDAPVSGVARPSSDNIYSYEPIIDP